MYYLLSRSYLIQQSHIFNHVTNSTVLPRFTFSSISKVYKFTGLIWFHSLISFNSPTHSTVSQIQFYYLLSRSYFIQQSQHIQQWNKFNSLIWFNSIISFNSSKYSTFSKIKFYYLISHLSSRRQRYPDPPLQTPLYLCSLRVLSQVPIQEVSDLSERVHSSAPDKTADKVLSSSRPLLPSPTDRHVCCRGLPTCVLVSGSPWYQPLGQRSTPCLRSHSLGSHQNLSLTRGARLVSCSLPCYHLYQH